MPASAKKSLFRLQLIQNSTARILTLSRKRDHISPILASLHWLPVALRIGFKILLITYKAQRGLAPSYLSDLLLPYVPSCFLRSSDALFLVVPRSRLIHKGDRAFSFRAPRLWNNLPEEIRAAKSVLSLKSLLKTHLFKITFWWFRYIFYGFYSFFYSTCILNILFLL